MDRFGLATATLAAVAVLVLRPTSAAAQIIGRTASFDGLEIEYEVASSGPTTLLFVHGWLCDRSFWREQVPQFSPDYGVVTLDLGGHGGSGSDRSDWSIDSFARDVAAVVRALDLRNVVLVGHSMGGPVVAEAARLLPDRVARVIGADTYQYVGAEWLQGQGVPNLVRSMERDYQGSVRRFVSDMFTPSSDSTLVQSVLAGMLLGPQDMGISATRSLFEWYRDKAVEMLASIEQPVATINSGIYVRNGAAQLQRLVPGIRVEVIPDVGHFVMLEAPEDFNARLIELVTMDTRQEAVGSDGDLWSRGRGGWLGRHGRVLSRDIR